MRFVKFFFLGAVTLFAVFTALSLLFPSHLRVSRVVNVPVSRERTLEAIAELRSWGQWNQLIRNTQLTNLHYSSPSTGKGAWLSSDQLAVHELGADSNGVTLQWDLKGGKRYAGGIDLMTVNRDSLAVQWYFDLDFRWYPWEKMGAFVYDRKLGPAMEESLDSLRLFLEKSR
ncbi:hypothetical protein [Puia sp.]|jgi:hypothetical protein|uniref:hypothetical protein n=1 Tax=Puia sp. TaxID=2045100 RepID=UPI002F420C52